MTAPLWMASPPELHSALLSTGPGPGPLLAAAAAWASLSTAYATAAAELTGLLDGVQGAWDGPTAQAYAAAHAPYLAWLTQAAADSATRAAVHEAAATAYTAALAAMPTLAELAANHATHAALVATNFFGVNTIPIALNEADYLRMWIQAATVMSVYQTESSTAIASAPESTAAPQIMKADTAAFDAATLPPDRQNEIYQWLEQSGFIDFYNESIQPLIDALYNSPFFQGMFGGFDPWLPILGNPLTYFSPLNIAFALGYPMDIGTYVALLSQMFSFVALDLTAAFASGNPATIGFTILFTTVEVIGTVITDTIALLKTLLEQTLVLLTVLVPLLTAPLLPLAAGAVLAPIGLKGFAALLSVPPAPPVAPPVTAPALVLAPSIPASTSSPTPTAGELTASAPAPGPLPPSTPAPPGLTGAGTIAANMGAGMENFAYLVGDLNSAARTEASISARKHASAPDVAQNLPITTTPEDEAPKQRRRRTKAQVLGRGYEYMDLEPDPETVASDGGAGPRGFAGTATKAGARQAAGLITLTGGGLGGASLPMMPATWEPDSP